MRTDGLGQQPPANEAELLQSTSHSAGRKDFSQCTRGSMFRIGSGKAWTNVVDQHAHDVFHAVSSKRLGRTALNAAGKDRPPVTRIGTR
jgi:hypothetical protein